jgi:hypothetical protein
MKFRDVKVGEKFDFTLLDGCIKLSARKYAYRSNNEYNWCEVGTINVRVTNVRAVSDWELEEVGLLPPGGNNAE